MSLSAATKNDFLKLYYKGTAVANMADNAASSPFTNIYVALHTANPGSAGDQTTSEAAYTGYARVAVARGAGWTVTTNSVSPAASITFPQATAAHTTVYYFSTGVAASGASQIIHYGVIGSMEGPFTGATDDNITIPGHTLVVDDRVAFFASYGGTMPTGITEGTVYWVKTIATDVITIAATQAGTVINVTVAGDGVAFKVDPIVTSVTTTPILSTSTTLKVD